MPIERDGSCARFSQPGDELAKWYVAYTQPGHENRVACQLQAQAIPFYLPSYQQTRRPGCSLRNHRNSGRILPLFPGSLFARIPWIDRALILGIPGVLSVLEGQRQALPIPDSQIAFFQTILDKVHARPHPYLDTGERVRIQSGPLCGLHGILQHQGLRVLVVLTFKVLSRSMVVEADGWDLQPL